MQQSLSVVLWGDAVGAGLQNSNGRALTCAMNGIPGRPDLCRAGNDVQSGSKLWGKSWFRSLVLGLVSPCGDGGNTPARSQAPMVWLEGMVMHTGQVHPASEPHLPHRPGAAVAFSGCVG